MPRQPDIPEPLPATATPGQAAAWVRRLVRFVGPGFHPDTTFDEYVKPDGTPSFSSRQCDTLERGLQTAWAVLDRAGRDIYSIALSVQRRMLAAR